MQKLNIPSYTAISNNFAQSRDTDDARTIKNVLFLFFSILFSFVLDMCIGDLSHFSPRVKIIL